MKFYIISIFFLFLLLPHLKADEGLAPEEFVKHVKQLHQKYKTTEDHIEERKIQGEISFRARTIPDKYPEDGLDIALELAEYFAIPNPITGWADSIFFEQYSNAALMFSASDEGIMDLVKEQIENQTVGGNTIALILIKMDSEESFDVLNNYLQTLYWTEIGSEIGLVYEFKFNRYDPRYFNIFKTLIFNEDHQAFYRERYLRFLIDFHTYRPSDSLPPELPTIEDASPEILVQLHAVLLRALDEFDFKSDDLREMVEERLAEVEARMAELGLDPDPDFLELSMENDDPEAVTDAPVQEPAPKPAEPTEADSDTPNALYWVIPGALALALLALVMTRLRRGSHTK